MSDGILRIIQALCKSVQFAAKQQNAAKKMQFGRMMASRCVFGAMCQQIKYVKDNEHDNRAAV
jgi:hypothetical protein